MPPFPKKAAHPGRRGRGRTRLDHRFLGSRNWILKCAAALITE